MGFNVDSAVSLVMMNVLEHLNVRIGEHNGISQLTKKQVKPKNNIISDHLLFCKYSATNDDSNPREQNVFTRIER